VSAGVVRPAGTSAAKTVSAAGVSLAGAARVSTGQPAGAAPQSSSSTQDNSIAFGKKSAGFFIKLCSLFDWITRPYSPFRRIYPGKTFPKVLSAAPHAAMPVLYHGIRSQEKYTIFRTCQV
jgi:hypothetical protein